MNGVRVDLSSGEEVTYMGQNGQKNLVRVRERVRITFSFISTGTGSVPLPVLRGMVWGLIQVKKNIFLMFNIRLQKQARSAPSRCKFKQGQNYIIFSSNLATARQLPDNCPKANSNKGKIGVSKIHSNADSRPPRTDQICVNAPS